MRGQPGPLIDCDAGYGRCYSLPLAEGESVSLPINQGDRAHPWHSQSLFSSKSWHQIVDTI